MFNVNITNLKCCMNLENKKIIITARNLYIRIFKKICIMETIFIFYENG